MQEKESEGGRGSTRKLIFYAEILLRELAREFDQDPIGRRDVAVAEVEDRLRSVARESSQMVEESNLDTVPAMRVPLLRCRRYLIRVFWLASAGSRKRTKIY